MAELGTLNDYAEQGRSAVYDLLYNGKFSKNASHWEDSWVNMAAQLAQQAFENDSQYKLWEDMNAYNSPSAQMQRFKDAGLNPMLAYTQGTPGNASSPAGFTSANYELSPHRDRMTQIQEAAQTIGMVTNLCNNLASIFETGANVQLKRNELAWSNTEVAGANRYITDFGKRNGIPKYRAGIVVDQNGIEQPYFPTSLNPFSNDFSPLEFNTLTRLGKIPNYFGSYLTQEPSRDYKQFQADYQKFYNERLLPLFERYQENKADISDIEEEMLNYKMDMMNMIPPEWRGIIEPVLDWISPFFKFIFKRSSGSFNHSVR